MTRGYSYSPSPPPRGGGYGRRGRSPSPRGRYGGRGGGRDGPTSLLVRNLRRECRPDDLRRQFSQFGRIKDIYLPRDYYSGEPRGFGFVQYDDPADAAEAKYQMDGQVLLGREITIVFAEENRKKPIEMRTRERRGGSSHDHRKSSRRSRSPHRSCSRSPHRSCSRSPHRSCSRSPRRSRSRTPRNGGPRSRGRSYSSSPKKKHYSRSVSSEPRKAERAYSHSPINSRSRSRSPAEDYPVKSSQRERSLSVSH